MMSGPGRFAVRCVLAMAAGTHMMGAGQPGVRPPDRPADRVLLAPAAIRQDVLTVREEVSSAVIVRVDDGDSVLAREGTHSIRLHLDGVDAPELSQQFGPEARQYLSELVVNRTIRVRVTARAARDGESRARLELGGVDVSTMLLRRGLARYCGRHSDDSRLQQAEAEARKAGRGLWAQPDLPSPWQHRGVAECWQETPAR